jgi:hypothetical protein
MEKFYNIDEQRHWNEENAFTENGDEWSGRFGSTENLYNQLLQDKVEKYCKGEGLEIAPGWGRITEYLIPNCNSLSLVDLNEYCISKCVNRFGNRIKSYHVNDGKSLTSIPDNSLDFIFSFDSFVHIHFNVFCEYILEFNRVMKEGSYGIIHHSFFGGGEDFSFRNFGGRANCDVNELNSFLLENGFEIVSQEHCVVSVWYDDLQDLITVFRKIKK